MLRGIIAEERLALGEPVFLVGRNGLLSPSGPDAKFSGDPAAEVAPEYKDEESE
jgi:hypothetical protein